MKSYFIVLFTLFLILAFVQNSFAGDLKWREISKYELEMNSPKVTPTSDAEAIFREMRGNNSKPYKIWTKNYTRIKIFTERGRKLFSTLEFPITGKLKNFGARIISPKGKIQVIKESDFFDKKLIKIRNYEKKSKATPIPNLEIGSILEYQYEESINSNYSSYNNPYLLDFEWHIPIQRMTYIIKMNGDFDKWVTFAVNMQNLPLKPDVNENNYYVISARNLLPFQEERFMPPRSVVRKLTLIRKHKTKLDRNVKDLWSAFAGNYLDRAKRIKQISKHKDTRRRAKQITANAKNNKEKIKLLYETIQSEIKNWQLDPNFTEEDRNNLPLNKPPTKMFKTKIGYGEEIDNLFAGMAKSLGFDVKLGLSNDRREYLYNGSNFNLLQFTKPVGFYIKLNDKWQFFSPASSFMRFGDSFWHFTGTVQLLIDEKNWISHQVPVIDADKNNISRKAKFTINEEGDLSGTARITLTGHEALNKRIEHKNLNIDDIKNNLLERYKKNFANVEINNFKIYDNRSEKPFYSISFDLKIQKYADKNDKRIILKPAIFQHNAAPFFVYSKRTHPIYFANPWSETDEITYILPADFHTEESLLFNIKDANNNTSLKVKSSYNEANQTLNYRREFTFGSKNQLLFSKKSYGEVKRLFDTYNKADSSFILLTNTNKD